MSAKYLIGPVTLTSGRAGFLVLIPVWARVEFEAGDAEQSDLVNILEIGTTADIMFEEDDFRDIIYSPENNCDRRDEFMEAFGTDGWPDSHIELAFRQGSAEKVRL